MAREEADVVVLGAGLAGLSAALGLARSGRRVLLLERDEPAADADPDELFDGWERPGIAHFRQPHNFLGLARRVLLDHAPDVLAEILALGALEHRQYELLPGELEPGDEAFVSICARRPVVEAVLMRAVRDEPNVRLRPATRVVGLLSGDVQRNGTVRVAGVRTDAGGEIHAALVVDALGRTSRVGSWLEALGAPPIVERRSECGLLYYSRHFRFRDGVEMPPGLTLLRGPRGEIGYLIFVIFVGDNRTFCTTLMISPDDRELRVLKSEQAYMTVALSIPALVPWVDPDQSEPITPVLPMGSLQNLHRSLVVDNEPLAVGIQPIGDALCHTNPTFAYGASLAARHGFALGAIAGGTDDPQEIAVAFDDAVGADAGARYDAVAAEDRDRLRVWRGERLDLRTPDESMALFLRLTAYPAGAKDADLFRGVARRVNLFDPPDALGRNETLVARAEEIARDSPRPPTSGPTRTELLQAIAQASG